eukprot:4952062-Karenia_brevis.AAC.1
MSNADIEEKQSRGRGEKLCFVATSRFHDNKKNKKNYKFNSRSSNNNTNNNNTWGPTLSEGGLPQPGTRPAARC